VVVPFTLKRRSPLLSFRSVVAMFWLLVLVGVAGAEVSKLNPVVKPLVVLNPHSAAVSAMGIDADVVNLTSPALVPGSQDMPRRNGPVVSSGWIGSLLVGASER
jgi:hypothetical protein